MISETRLTSLRSRIVIRSVLSNDRIRQAFTLGTGTALGQLFVVAASPIWSRLYNPTDFGRYGLVLSFLSTVIVGGTFRYDLAIPLARDEDESLRLFLLALICTIPAALIAGSAFLWLTIRGSFGFGAVSPWSSILLVILLVLTSIFTALRYWHVRTSSFNQISSSLISQGLGRAVTPILLSPFGFGWLGLISGEVLGRSLGIRRLGLAVFPRLILVARRTSVQQLLALSRTFKQYPLVFLPSSVLDAASSAIAVPAFIWLYGVSAGGEFLMAQQVVMTPAAFISGSLADVFHSKLLTVRRGQGSEFERLVLRFGLQLLGALGLLYIPVALLAPHLAVPVFGASWARLGKFVAVLAPTTIVTATVSSLSRAMVFSRIPQIKFAADIVRLIVPVLSMIVASRLSGGSITAGIVTFSIANAVCYAFYFGIILFSVQPRYQLSTPAS